MTSFTSPFLSEIEPCKKSMRKLRKKIYKHSVSLKNPQISKQRSSEATIDMLLRRNIPHFLIESLNKRRHLDIHAVKNLSVQTTIAFGEVQARTNAQEQQILEIYLRHKERTGKLEQVQRVSKISFHLEETSESRGRSDQNGNMSDVSKDALFTSTFQMPNLESSINSGLTFFDF